MKTAEYYSMSDQTGLFSVEELDEILIQHDKEIVELR